MGPRSDQVKRCLWLGAARLSPQLPLVVGGNGLSRDGKQHGWGLVTGWGEDSSHGASLHPERRNFLTLRVEGSSILQRSFPRSCPAESEWVVGKHPSVYGGKRGRGREGMGERRGLGAAGLWDQPWRGGPLRLPSARGVLALWQVICSHTAQKGNYMLLGTKNALFWPRSPDF